MITKKQLTNISENVIIKISDSTGKPVLLNISKYEKDLLASAAYNINWAGFCTKITLKQKRYGEAGVCTLNFSLVSSYGAIGKSKKNSVIPNPIQLGDKVTITLNDKLDLAAYFDMGTDSLSNMKDVKYKTFFVGYVWNMKTNALGEVEITCYDLLKYLQNQRAFFSYKNADTGSVIIKEALSSLNLGKGENNIKLQLDMTLLNNYIAQTTGTEEKIFVYDKNFIDVVNWIINRALTSAATVDLGFATYILFMVDYETNSIVIGSSDKLGRIAAYTLSYDSMFTSCELSESIENDVFNTIYSGVDVVGTDIGEMAWGIGTETNSLKQLGTLPHYERFSESDFLTENSTLTQEIAADIIKKMVLLKSKPKVKLSIKSYGNPYLHAGMQVPIKLPESMIGGLGTIFAPSAMVVKDTPIVLIDEISHTITNNTMEMDFTSSVLLNNYVKWNSVDYRKID